MNITLIDNYDSFTYNLVHYLSEIGANVSVIRNDELSADEVMAQNPDKILISPGPCDPDKAGICLELIKKSAGNNIPLMGVCLGHQAIAQCYGGNIIRSDIPMHGKVSKIINNGTGVFSGLDKEFNATRYHSLIVEKATLPDCFNVTAWTADDTIMGISHKEHQLHGVQFHPESIESQYGHDILRNFCNDK